MLDMKIANRMLVVRCTYCNEPLFKTKSTIDLHMKSHQRKGVLLLPEIIEHVKTTKLNIIRRIL
jgi:hypothetical protein